MRLEKVGVSIASFFSISAGRRRRYGPFLRDIMVGWEIKWRVYDVVRFAMKEIIRFVDVYVGREREMVEYFKRACDFETDSQFLRNLHVKMPRPPHILVLASPGDKVWGKLHSTAQFRQW